ncbi:MAG: transcriptional regulator [Candidatus Aenigmatarchaeota archaeon]
MVVEKKQIPPKLRLARRLEEAGYDDVLVLKKETVEEVMTEKRMELVETVDQKEVESVSQLADELGRDIAVVSKDLKLLYESEIIGLEDRGGKKKPFIKHDNIFVEPLLMEA